MNALDGWANFYVIVGSSAGALIGLQFVVITLIADLPVRPGTEQAGSAFATPTIIHLGAVLLLAAALTAPWPGMIGVAIVWGILGAAGIVYVVVTARRMRAQSAYKPVFEDWLWHPLLPLLVYLTVIVASVLLHIRPTAPLFEIGACVLLLLFIGIHNSWDTVTYLAIDRRQEDPSSESGANATAESTTTSTAGTST